MSWLYAAVALLFGAWCTGGDSIKSTSKEGPAIASRCKSEVYCHGRLLEDVQLANSGMESFVQMKMKYPEAVVIERYQLLLSQNGMVTPSREVLQKFVDENFEEGNELEDWSPPDFTDRPSLIDQVSDQELKAWVPMLCQILRDLSRKVKKDVQDNPDRYSMLYVPNGFVIPGGIFKELYYWDSYWIMSGLLQCDMANTARGVAENLLYLLREHGIVPNGNRKYYLDRSQPPLLTPMVDMYYRESGNLTFVRDNLSLLDEEFRFWMEDEDRMVVVKKDDHDYKLARYFVHVTGPRPEGFRKDYMTAQTLDDSKRDIFYSDIRAACESGLDFSSRWFINNGGNSGSLVNTKTSGIIPVELNAFLHNNAIILSSLHTELGNTDKAEDYKRRAEEILHAIHAVLWNEDQGIWLDYDIYNQKSRDYFYMSNFAPLWTGSYLQDKVEISQRVLDYLAKSDVGHYKGGIPTSKIESGEQWDFPNAWAPLQAILIQGLYRLQTEDTHAKALEIAQKWLRSTYTGYEIHSTTYEKYDVTKEGETGGGGEYDPQKGFGWTVGVNLELLDMFGHSVTLSDMSKSPLPNMYWYLNSITESTSNEKNTPDRLNHIEYGYGDYMSIFGNII